MLKAFAGLMRLVWLNHNFLTDDRARMTTLILLDRNGARVPIEQVSGGQAFTPTPGQGYYAHIQRTAESAHRTQGQATTWMVEGPDWSGQVTVRQPPGLAPTVSIDVLRTSPEGISFLEQFAA